MASSRSSRGFTNDFTLDTTTTNLTDQMLGLCANNCFAATTSFSTVPYYTMDTPRSLTLVYNEDRAHPRPVVWADVTPTTGTPAQYTMQATLNGTVVPFLNGDTVIYFSGSSAAVRLAGQFDASSDTTGVYTLVVTVKASYASGGNAQHSYTRPLVIVNTAHSPLGRGWTVLDHQQLYFTSGGTYLITDGAGNAVTFSGLGVPAADYSVLTWNAPLQYYNRAYPDGSSVRFSSTGIDLQRFNNLGWGTDYSKTSFQLTAYIDPWESIRVGGLYYGLSYGANGLDSIRLLSTTSGGVRTRVSNTQVTTASDSTVRAITDADGVATKFVYDASGRLSMVIDRRGDTTTYKYDAHSWKLIEVDLPRIAADAGGGTTTTVVPKIKDTPWQTLGVPIVATSSSAPATPIARSAIHATVTDPVGNVTTMTVDRWGQPLVITDPLGRSTTITRSGMLPVKVVHPNTGIDTMAYVSGTPLLNFLRTAGDSAAINVHYGALNQIDSLWGSEIMFERRFLDATTGRVDSVQYAHSAAQMVRYTYDANNQPLSMKDPGTHTTTFHYDTTFGNLDSVSRPGNIYTMREFDAFGRDTTLRSAGSLVKQRIVYDTLNRVRKMWHAGITNDTTIVTYDALFPTRVRAPGGVIHKFVTNALGWVTQRYDSKDTTLFISYRYDTAGRLTSLTNRRGQMVTMTYDALDRMLSRTVNATLTDYFDYDTNDRWVSAWRSNVSRDTTFYNINGEVDSVVQKIAGHRYATQYLYYFNGQYTSRTVSYSSDAGFNLLGHGGFVGSVMPTTDSVHWLGTFWAGASPTVVTTQPRDVDGRPTSVQMGVTGVQTANHFSALHQQYWSALTIGTRSAVRDSLSIAYGRDSLGRVIFNGGWDNAQGQVPNRYFVYDSLGQLLKVSKHIDSACSVPSDTLALGFQYSCGKTISTTTQDNSLYDISGNRLFPGDTANPAGNRIPYGPGGISYTYDADGNIATRTHGSITDAFYWSATGLLDSVRSYGTFFGLRHWYEYNSYGQLVRRQTSHSISGPDSVDRYFLWEEDRLLAELDCLGTSYRSQYVYSGEDDQPIAIITPRTSGTATRAWIRTYYQDPVEGNLTGITADGTTLQQYTQYSAWGQVLQNINTVVDTNRLGWKGLMYEGDSTKLYYVRNRWYDPAIGRFVSEDPLGIAGGSNLYAFAGNDPINGKDPSGLLFGGEEGGFEGWDGWGSFLDPIGHQFLDAAWNSLEHHRHPHGQRGGTAANQGRAGEFSTGYATNSTQIFTRVGQLLTPFNKAVTTGPSGFAVMLLVSPEGELGELTEGMQVLKVTFGHGARHLVETGLSEVAVEGEILSSLRNQLPNGIPTTVSGPFTGRITVEGVPIEFRGFGRPNDIVNIGTYFPIK